MKQKNMRSHYGQIRMHRETKRRSCKYSIKEGSQQFNTKVITARHLNITKRKPFTSKLQHRSWSFPRRSQCNPQHGSDLSFSVYCLHQHYLGILSLKISPLVTKPINPILRFSLPVKMAIYSPETWHSNLATKQRIQPTAAVISHPNSDE